MIKIVKKKVSKKQLMVRRIITTIIFIILILGSSVYFANKVAANSEAKKEAEVARQEEFLRQKTEELQFKIDEILNAEHDKVVQAIDEEVNGNANYGVYYQDLVGGYIHEVNSTKSFIAASTIKVPLVIGASDLIASGKLSPDSTVNYMSSDYEGGTGILQESSELNSPIKVSRIMELAITHSDNIATQMLIRTSTSITTVINNLTGIPRKSGGNYINAKQLGILLKRLYDNEENNPQYDIMIENMKNTNFHDRLDKYIEPQSIVAHKIGNNGGYTHDTGIIYTKRPYTLTVLTESIGSETIAVMNKKIYDIKLETDKSIEELKVQYKEQFGVSIK